ncbi:U6 snRNA phosphodiesterase 1 [Cladobotryum mycophilum]|uniref:U6 snRNA phosphodiesterase n=1 Tax=Cladobotryum mycophilum TaxID=491253 RepID=A0ABR0SJX8_9HYPO
MALVNYSSSSPSSASNSEDEQESPAPEPPAKRLKSKPLDDSGSRTAPERAVPAAPESELPPLPPAFHDLYASTVRQSVVDDPSLHQGRKRQIPHVVGNWPSHLYIEWHPTRAQYDVLVQLVNQVDKALGRGLQLHNFLTSDLGAPLPLHISLSRPIALSTSNKDEYLDKVSSAIRNCRAGVFSVTPRRLAWYRSPDSNRTFLILQVASKAEERLMASPNPELVALLTACNDVSMRFDQPVLYQENKHESADDAFHISIGWALGLPVDEVTLKALEPFEAKQFRQVQSWKIEVSGVKAKVGNVVSHIALAKGETAVILCEKHQSPYLDFNRKRRRRKRKSSQK